MPNNHSDKFTTFAEKQMQTQEADIRRWASQSDNPLLRQLAREVMEAAGERKEKLEK